MEREARMPQLQHMSPVGIRRESAESMEDEMRRFIGPGTNRVIRG